jgi:hypothetical protein
LGFENEASAGFLCAGQQNLGFRKSKGYFIYLSTMILRNGGKYLPGHVP